MNNNNYRDAWHVHDVQNAMSKATYKAWKSAEPLELRKSSFGVARRNVFIRLYNRKPSGEAINKKTSATTKSACNIK